MPLPIAVDAMGGDHAPGEIVRGALRAVREHGITVTLVGRREAVDDALRSAGAATPEAVSYTHLDVYKRQGLDLEGA